MRGTTVIAGRRLGVLVGVAGLLAVLVTGGVRYLGAGKVSDNTAAPRRTVAGRLGTAEVVRTDLSDYTTETGTLGYKKGRTLRGLGSGLVTWLPKSGASVTRGEPLFRVDDRPVSLFYGTTPLFRELGTVGTVGRDVKVLADNLRALGYRIGEQPTAGTRVTVSGPRSGAPTPDPTSSASASYRVRVTAQDGVFTAALKDAVKRWQSDRGIYPPTGTIDFGDVIVLPGRVRIGAVTAVPGDAATEDLMSVTAQTKSVSVLIDASEADGINVGDKVRITLPDSTFTSGTVSAVSANVQPKPGDDPATDSDQPKVEITIAFDKPDSVKRINSADVEVRFAGTIERNVLAVPVGALLALSGGGYAVQVSGGGLVPVKLGVFADGLVQITGTTLPAGTRVVTTS
jgi:peptidoglycan hydrolase-like protein with peptidoglycan-binding domain